MLSKNARKELIELMKDVEAPFIFSKGFYAGYQIAQDEAKAEIEKLRAALVRIKDVSQSGRDDLFYVIAIEALQKDDEVKQ